MFLSSADFFSILTFSKMQLKNQTVWIQIRPDILSGQIWVQTVCKNDQQTTVAGAELINVCNYVF